MKNCLINQKTVFETIKADSRKYTSSMFLEKVVFQLLQETAFNFTIKSRQKHYLLYDNSKYANIKKEKKNYQTSYLISTTALFLTILNCVFGREILILLMIRADERWLSMAKIWTENRERKSMPSSLLSVHNVNLMPCEKTCMLT